MREKGSAFLGFLALLLLGGWAILSYIVLRNLWPGSAGYVMPFLAGGVLAISIAVLLLSWAPKSATVWSAPGGSALRIAYRVAGVAAVAAAALVSVGFTTHLIGSGTEALGRAGARPQAPPCVPGPFDSLLAYAHRLDFDNWTHGTADSGIILDAGLAIKARIAPEKAANLIRHEDLEGTCSGKGRIVARIELDEAHTGLGLPAGVSYIWVDSLKISTDPDTTGSFRAFIIPDRPGASVLRFTPGVTFEYFKSRRAFANFPMSRWLLHGSTCLNTSCSKGCCRACD